MKIARNEKEGKYIIDFEGLEIDVSDVKDTTLLRDKEVVKINLVHNCSDGGLGFCQSLWNDDVVSEVRNGVWLFEPKATIAFFDDAPLDRPVAEKPVIAHCRKIENVQRD